MRRASESVRGGNLFWLALRHLRTVAGESAIARLGDEYLDPAGLTVMALADLEHVGSSYFGDIGCEQQATSPSPPLVTMISPLHTWHLNRFPAGVGMARIL